MLHVMPRVNQWEVQLISRKPRPLCTHRLIVTAINIYVTADDTADIDECSVDNGGCAAVASCTNTQGAFTCSCNDGYDGDGFTCTGL